MWTRATGGKTGHPGVSPEIAIGGRWQTMVAIQNRAACIKILAERRAGELLKEIERSKGGGQRTTSTMKAVLSDNKIAESTGLRWQTIARVPEERIRGLEAELTEAEQELTSALIHREGQGKPHVAQNAGESEWYTPKVAVREGAPGEGGVGPVSQLPAEGISPTRESHFDLGTMKQNYPVDKQNRRPENSSFRELGCALGWKPKDWVLMLYAYLDDSGESSLKPRTVGGCIATFDAWKKFEEAWASVLVDSRFDVQCFHATDFEAGQGNFEHPKWKDETLRQNFRAALASVLRSHVMAIAGCVIPERYAHHKNVPGEKSRKRPKEELWDMEWNKIEREPYLGAFSWCVQALVRGVEHGENECVHLVVADQPGLNARIVNLYDHMKLLSGFADGLCEEITTGSSPLKTIPLQAADLVAYYFWKRERSGWMYRELRKFPRHYFHEADVLRLFDGWIK